MVSFLGGISLLRRRRKVVLADGRPEVGAGPVGPGSSWKFLLGGAGETESRHAAAL